MGRMKLEGCPSKTSCQRQLASTNLQLAGHFITIHNLLLDSELFENIWIYSDFLQIEESNYVNFAFSTATRNYIRYLVHKSLADFPS